MSVDRFLEIANGAVGLCAADASFRALVGPGENATTQAALAKKSTCALFVRGCLAQVLCERFDNAVFGTAPHLPEPKFASVVPPRLWTPYVDGTVVTTLVDTLTNTGRDPASIRRGSVVIVGEGISTHVFIVYSIESDGYAGGKYDVTAIEAGQKTEAGLQCVVKRRHEIVVGADGRAFDCAYEWDEKTERWVLASSARPVTHVLDPRPLLEGGAA